MMVLVPMCSMANSVIEKNMAILTTNNGARSTSKKKSNVGMAVTTSATARRNAILKNLINNMVYVESANMR